MLHIVVMSLLLREANEGTKTRQSLIANATVGLVCRPRVERLTGKVAFHVAPAKLVVKQGASRVAKRFGLSAWLTWLHGVAIE